MKNALNALSEYKMGAILGLTESKETVTSLTSMSEETKWQLALAYAVVVVGKSLHAGEVYIPFIDQTVMEVLNCFQPVYQTVGYSDEGRKLVGYQTAEKELSEWRELFTGNARAAGLIRRYLSKNVALGYTMPHAANEFASLILEGGLKEPPRPPKKKSMLHRDTLLAGVAKKVTASFEIPLGATKLRLSQSTPPLCGCVIGAAALFGHGIIVNFPRADAICRNPNLPIDVAAKSYVFSPDTIRPLPSKRNYLVPIPPDEFRADPNLKYAAEYERAAKHIGIRLPILDDWNSGR